MISLVKVPQRQTNTRCSMFANLGWGSDRSNVVRLPQASQLGFGVFLRMGDQGSNAASPGSFRWN